MSNARDPVTEVTNISEDEPEEGEIQDDDGSLMSLSSESGVSTAELGCKFPYCDNNISNVTSEEIPHTSVCQFEDVPRIYVRRYKRFCSSAFENKSEVSHVYNNEVNVNKTGLCRFRITSFVQNPEQERVESNKKYLMERSNHVKEDTAQEKENRHCHTDLRGKKICKRKKQQYDARKSFSNSCISDIKMSSMRHDLIEQSRKRKLETKYVKKPHPKKKTFSPKRQKHKHPKKKTDKKHVIQISNSRDKSNNNNNNNNNSNSGNQDDSQENSLKKRLQTMMSLKLSHRRDIVTTANESHVLKSESHVNETTDTNLSMNSVALNTEIDSNAGTIKILKETDQNHPDIEIIPVADKCEPLVITIEDSDSDPQISISKENKELETKLDPGSTEKCLEISHEANDENDEDLIQLRLLALQSSRRQKELPKPKVEDDEVMQLRLAALKSAIVKKCQLRKQRGFTLKSKNYKPLKHDESDMPFPSALDQPSCNIQFKKAEDKTVSEPDEITTLVDMELSLTDDEKEVESYVKSLPDTELFSEETLTHTYDQVIENTLTFNPLENNPISVSKNHAKNGPLVEWSSSVSLTRNNSDPISGSHIEKGLNVFGPQLLFPSSTISPQDFDQESQSCSNSNAAIPLESQSSVLPIPEMGGTDCCGYQQTDQNYVQFNTFGLNETERNEKAGLPSIVSESVQLPVNMTMSSEAVSKSVNTSSKLHHSDSSLSPLNMYFQNKTSNIMDNIVEYNAINSSWDPISAKVSPDLDIQQIATTLATPLSCIRKSGMQDSGEYSNVQTYSMFPEEYQKCRSEHSLEQKNNVVENVKSKIVDNQIFTPENKEVNTSVNEGVTDSLDNFDEDEEMLRAQVLTTLTRKSVKNSDFIDQSHNINHSDLCNSNPVVLRDVPVKSINDTNRNAKIMVFHNSVRNHLSGRPRYRLPNSSNHLMKFTKFSHKFICKKMQPFQKTCVNSSANKHWKGTLYTTRRQALTKVNEGFSLTNLHRNTKQIMSCKPEKKAFCDNTKSKAVPLQIKVPKKIVNDNFKIKVLKQVTTSLPNQRFVINLSEDSDSGEDDNETHAVAVPKQRCITESRSPNLPVPKRVKQSIKPSMSEQTAEQQSSVILPSSDLKIPGDFEKSVDVFLKQVRMSQEATIIPGSTANNSSATPQAVCHLPSSQQEEYRRLKLQIAKREEQRKLRQYNFLNKLSFSSTNKNIATKFPFKITVTDKNSAVKESVKEDSVPCSARTVVTSPIRNNCTMRSELNKAYSNNLIISDKSFSGLPVAAIDLNSEKCNQVTDVEEQPTILAALSHVENCNEDISGKKDSNKCLSSDSKVDGIQDPIINAQQPNLQVEKRGSTLAEIEQQLLSKRCEVLDNLKNMTSLLDQMELERSTENRYVKELQHLNSEVHRVQRELAQQKKLISSMNTSIAEAHKLVAKGRSECISLSKMCSSLGIIIQGREYKVPTDGTELLNDRLQQVSAQTKRISKKKDNLEDFDENKLKCDSFLCNDLSEQNETITEACDESKNTKCICEKSSLVLPTEYSSNSTQGTYPEDKNMYFVFKEKSRSSEDLVLKIPNQSGSPSTLKSDEFVPVIDSTENIETECVENIKRISTGEQEEFYFHGSEVMAMGLNNDSKQVTVLPFLTKYQSPLEHLGVRRYPHECIKDRKIFQNPLAILCPFELMGCCQDEECSFQHHTRNCSM